MKITIEEKSKPCPGVERALSMAEEVLRRGDSVFSVGELIHNRREVTRLEKLGLKLLGKEAFAQLAPEKSDGRHFLVRAHGELVSILHAADDKGFHRVDATCPMVKHSQDLISQHIRDGWNVIIAGRKDHPEVMALLERCNGNGQVISTVKEAKTSEMDERSLLIAQTTINGELYKSICHELSVRLNTLKIVDTTCRFVGNRLKQVEVFSRQNDVLVFVGGKNSANGRLLYETAKKVNPRAWSVEEPGELDATWFEPDDRVGVFGGASTPRWQLEEVKSYLETLNAERAPEKENNPKGLKNRKGGPIKWLTWKKQNKKK